MSLSLPSSPALVITVAATALLLAACLSAGAGQPAASSPAPAPAASPTPAGPQVWLTLADQSKKLAAEPALTPATGPASGLVIAVDTARQYQVFEGAGAAMTDSSAWLIMNQMGADQRARLLANLFTRAGDGIGLSYLRVPLGASDFALSDYTYNDIPGGGADPELKYFSIAHDEAYILPALRAARDLNPQLRLMGSPWSAPAWMKGGASLNGGALREEHFAAFAQYHVKVAQAYAAAGLPFDALTPQNEPMYQSASYPTMGMSAAQQQAFVRDHLGPALEQAGLSPRVLILDHNWDLADYALEVLNDPAAARYVAGVAFHCYGGNVDAQSVVQAAHPDKSIWFTECSGGDWATSWAGNVSWNLRQLVIGNFRHWGASLLLWNLALDEEHGPRNGGCQDCRGVVTINAATGAVQYNEEYTILGHVTKFVDPGARRVESTFFPEGGPENVAFLNPDGALVVIVHATRAVDFAVEWNGQHLAYHLPAYATATFRWPAGQ